MEEALIFMLGLVVALALLILPILTLIFVLKVRGEQREQRQLLDVIMLRSEQPKPVAEQPLSEPQPEPVSEPQPVVVPVFAPPPQPEPASATEFEPPAPVLPPPIPLMAAAVRETISPFPTRTVPLVAESAGVPPPPPQAPPEFQSKADQVLQRIWNWIVIGEEYRTPGTSWEFAVATNWLLRLGIVIAVIGVGFFLKYSIEHGWIGPMARVTMSVVTGVVMLAGGARLLQKPYHLLGQGLIGGGLAVLYFSMFAAFNFYHLISMVAAFALMAVVTLSAGVMAVRFSSMLIAILGILGGYGTPIMLSTGTVNFPGLFGYLLLLGVGVLGIARLRSWPLLSYLGMLLTYFLALGAIRKYYTAADFPLVLAFLAAFYLLYAAVMILRNLAEREKITILELLGSFANTMLFFGLAYHVITHDNPEKYAALLTLALAAVNILLAYGMLARRQNDRGLLCMFLALAAMFLALTPPLAISKQWITASWALQGLIMLWLAGKLDSRFLRLLACGAYLLAAGRLAVLDFHQQFAAALAENTTWLDYLKILGTRLFEMVVPIAAFGGAWKLLRQPPPKGGLAVERSSDLTSEAWQPSATIIAAVAAVGLLFVYAQFELHHTCAFFYPALAVPSMSIAWFALGLFLLAIVRTSSKFWKLALLAIVSIGIVFKLLMVDMLGWALNSATWIYGTAYPADVAVIRLMDYALCLGLLALAFGQLRGHEVARPLGLVAGYAAIALLFFYLTLELNTALAHFLPASRSGCITLLWAAYALALLIIGLQRTVRSLRFIGLALFGLVIFKVFGHDLAHLDPFYRIIAFIVLGLILLGAALIYLKFRQRFQIAPPKKGDQP
ncbi:MAG: DUF2339 domain-containing protein, partial [Kiritimatiellaeota bacterium]|nr:DUF2339 domain-containing protein [Kiritimatiellota bacterium]